MNLGPLMLDVAGLTLSEEDHQRLSHPLVGGVILFARNYADPAQLRELCTAIHAIKSPPLLIAADQEGGRVQRFRNGFTRLPPMRRLGELWDQHPQQARHRAHDCGYVMAAELRACGIDLSFAPVLDLASGASQVIGDRAFHARPDAVAALARSLVDGMHAAGMAACGKHFPGHGNVTADSHVAVPVDPRRMDDIAAADLAAFRPLIAAELPAIMPAHVIYPHVDPLPAGFSAHWLRQVLRHELGFRGMIFSDDLTMEGAAVAGDIVARTHAALTAGCDMALICNRPDLADQVLARLAFAWPASSRARLIRLHGGAHPPDLAALREQTAYVEARHRIAPLADTSAPLAFDPTQSHVKS
jgi:beta-N-acetylhexosaminidase